MWLGSAVAALSLQLSSQASITGQWDFKSGGLNATIGTDMTWADGTTSSTTVFGTTTALGIPNIGGTNTAVMGFPNLLTAGDPYGGVQCFVGASPNGGGNNVNQYTVIEDIFFPNAADLKPRALFVTDNGGEFLLTAGDQLSLVGAISGGSFTPNTWHRIAVTVDTTSTGGFGLYIDGTSVATASAISGGVDGKYSISSELFLFDDAAGWHSDGQFLHGASFGQRNSGYARCQLFGTSHHDHLSGARFPGFPLHQQRFAHLSGQRRPQPGCELVLHRGTLYSLAHQRRAGKRCRQHHWIPLSRGPGSCDCTARR